MLTVQEFSLILLALATIGTILKRGRPFVAKHVASFARVSVAAVFLFVGYWSFAQYLAWLPGETTRYLLPPYQSINYFYCMSAPGFLVHIFCLWRPVSLLFIWQVGGIAVTRTVYFTTKNFISLRFPYFWSAIHIGSLTR